MDPTAAAAAGSRDEAGLAWPLRPLRGWTGSPLWLGAAAVALYAGAAALEPERDAAGAPVARLPGLLAYEQRIADVPESLVDAGSLRRIGLYLLIPLSSWICGALVERLVDRLLG